MSSIAGVVRSPNNKPLNSLASQLTPPVLLLGAADAKPYLLLSGDLPADSQLEQADGTAWMGMFCLNMLTIALELAIHNIACNAADCAATSTRHLLASLTATNPYPPWSFLWGRRRCCDQVL